MVRSNSYVFDVCLTLTVGSNKRKEPVRPNLKFNHKMEHDPNLVNLIKEKIQFGQDLLDPLAKYKEVDGIQKLGRKINQELNFLRKVM